MGKTTLVHKMVQDWAMNRGDGGHWLNQQFDVVILVRLGSLGKDQDLHSFLSTEIISAQDAKDLISHIVKTENQMKVLIVLHAFDETSYNKHFTELIKNQKLDQPIRNVTFLITYKQSVP